jgi:ATP-dependent RNA helicase RhlE
MLHGSIEQNERFAILDRFRNGENKVLVTTDVASRGIDLPNVEHVINYDLPDNPENYVHRCGRCGRGNNKGYAISFCSSQEQNLLTDIEDYTGEEINRYELTKEEYKTIVKDTEDITYNWQKLIDDDNKEMGTEDEW